MNTEEIIIKYVLYMLKHDKFRKLQDVLEVTEKLLVALPSYLRGEILSAIFTIEEDTTNAE